MRFTKLFFGFAICAVLAMFTGQAQAVERAEIAAVVNDDIITTTDIRTRLLLNTGGRAVPKADQQIAYNAVLDELINEVLQRQEARSLNITVDDQQVRDAFATVARNNGMDTQQFRAQLGKMGVPIETFYDKLRTDISWSQVVRRKLRPQIAISENDIDAVFDDLDRVEGKTQYRVAEIFVKGGLEATQNAVAQQKIDMIAKQLQSGMRFSEVAKRHSESAGASRGGDLGYLTLDQLDPAFQPHVLSMAPGTLSKPVKTTEGYHLLLLIDKKEPVSAQAPTPAPQPVQTTQSDKLRLQQIFLPIAADEPTALRAAKMGRAKSLGGEIQGCEQMKTRFENFKSPLTGDLGYVDVNDLPADVSTQVKSLPVGTLSQPMVNKDGIFVLMVCERKTAPKTVMAANENVAPTAESRNDEGARENVANKIGLQKLDILQQRYLRDLRAAAFIDRRI